MAKTYNEIPTLTHVVHSGDEDMLNHFDAHELEKNETSKSKVKEKNKNKQNFKLENATDIENTKIDSLDLNDIPSMTTEHARTTELPKQDFTEAMQANTKQPGIKKSAKKPADNKELKEKIDQAISEALPGIEAQLKGKLYSKFGI